MGMMILEASCQEGSFWGALPWAPASLETPWVGPPGIASFAAGLLSSPTPALLLSFKESPSAYSIPQCVLFILLERRS